MLSQIYSSRKREETGFTLIELLVVVIIIGILAAIAIPVFIDQSRVAVDAAVASDVHNTALEVQEWRANNPSATAADASAYVAANGKVTHTVNNGYIGLVVRSDGSYGVCGYNVKGKKYTGPATSFVFDSTTGQFGLGDGCQSAITSDPAQNGTITNSDDSTSTTVTNSDGSTTTTTTATDGTTTTTNSPAAGGGTTPNAPVYRVDPAPNAAGGTNPRLKSGGGGNPTTTTGNVDPGPGSGTPSTTPSSTPSTSTPANSNPDGTVFSPGSQPASVGQQVTGWYAGNQYSSFKNSDFTLNSYWRVVSFNGTGTLADPRSVTFNVSRIPSAGNGGYGFQPIMWCWDEQHNVQSTSAYDVWPMLETTGDAHKSVTFTMSCPAGYYAYSMVSGNPVRYDNKNTAPKVNVVTNPGTRDETSYTQVGVRLSTSDGAWLTQ